MRFLLIFSKLENNKLIASDLQSQSNHICQLKAQGGNGKKSCGGRTSHTAFFRFMVKLRKIGKMRTFYAANSSTRREI